MSFGLSSFLSLSLPSCTLCMFSWARIGDKGDTNRVDPTACVVACGVFSSRTRSCHLTIVFLQFHCACLGIAPTAAACITRVSSPATCSSTSAIPVLPSPYLQAFRALLLYPFPESPDPGAGTLTLTIVSRFSRLRLGTVGKMTMLGSSTPTPLSPQAQTLSSLCLAAVDASRPSLCSFLDRTLL